LLYSTQKNHLRGLSKREYGILRLLTRFSKNLYNHTLYTVRQHFFTNNEYLRYEGAYHKIKLHETYQRLPSQVAQQAMKLVDRAMRSFIGLLKKKAQGTYPNKVGLPKYLPKTEHMVCIFPKDSFKVKEGKIRLSLGKTFRKLGLRYLYFQLPPQINDKTLKEVRILPRYQGRYFEMEYVYQVEPAAPPLDLTIGLGIDLGLNNFATCVSTNGTTFIMEGKGLKSYNCWWNKQKAKLQSVYDKQKYLGGNRMGKLLQKRQFVLRNFMAQTVNRIIQECLRQKIGTVVIGELTAIKQGSNLGRKTNQNFQYIPFGWFKQKLGAKCEQYGIRYVEVNEAYTSQTCSVCGVRRKKYRKYRGLYVCGDCGTVRNADVTGAINILKKVVPESSLKGIGNSGRVNRPRRIRIPTVLENQPSLEAPACRAE